MRGSGQCGKGREEVGGKCLRLRGGHMVGVILGERVDSVRQGQDLTLVSVTPFSRSLT